MTLLNAIISFNFLLSQFLLILHFKHWSSHFSLYIMLQWRQQIQLAWYITPFPILTAILSIHNYALISFGLFSTLGSLYINPN
jgi:hypothetical protein